MLELRSGAKIGEPTGQPNLLLAQGWDFGTTIKIPKAAGEKHNAITHARRALSFCLFEEILFRKPILPKTEGSKVTSQYRTGLQPYIASSKAPQHVGSNASHPHHAARGKQQRSKTHSWQAAFFRFVHFTIQWFDRLRPFHKRQRLAALPPSGPRRNPGQGQATAPSGVR